MRVRMTLKDGRLPHQISLAFDTDKNWLTVWCNCRWSALGRVRVVGGNPWGVYNDPSNHRGPVPFVPGQSTARTFDVT